MLLTTLDWIIVAVLGASMVVSLFRGFVREAISLAAWVAALVVASLYTKPVAMQMVDTLPQALLRHVLVFFLLFVGVLVVGALINGVVAKLVSAVGLGGLDRLLGMVFGLLRGTVIAVVLLAIAEAVMTPEQLRGIGEGSMLLPQLELLLQWTQQQFGELWEHAEPLRGMSSACTGCEWSN